MRVKRNYTFVIILLAGLIIMLMNSNVANGQIITIDFESLLLSTLTGSLKVTNQFNLKGINFSNATAVDSSAKPEFPHSGKQVIESCYGIEFCSAPISMTFIKPQKRVRIWAGFDYKGKYTIYLRAFDKYNNLIAQSAKIVTEPLILITGINPVKTSLNYKMSVLEVNAKSKSNAIVRAEVGVIPPNGIAGTFSVSVDDVEFERIR
jgi:hypothetical protein